MLTRGLQLGGGFQPPGGGGGGGPQLVVHPGTCIAVTHPAHDTVTINAEVACIQTPWITNINGNGHTLNNAGHIGIGAAANPGYGILVAPAGGSSGILITTSGATNYGVVHQELSATARGGFVAINDQGDLGGLIQGGSNDSIPLYRRNLILLAPHDLVVYTDTSSGFAHKEFIFTRTGHFGVGTTTPAYAVEAAGDMNITGANRHYRVNGVPLDFSGHPAGADGEIQYSHNGQFAASPRLEWDTTQHRLEIQGDINLASGHHFRINGVPLDLGEKQTPWLSNIEAADHNLANVGYIGIGGSASSLNTHRLFVHRFIPGILGITIENPTSTSVAGCALTLQTTSEMGNITLQNALSAFPGSGLPGLAINTTNRLSLQVGGTERACVTSTGLGIGMVAGALQPLFPLHVRAIGTIAAFLQGQLSVGGPCLVSENMAVNGALPTGGYPLLIHARATDFAGIVLQTWGPSFGYGIYQKEETATGRGGLLVVNDMGDVGGFAIHGSNHANPQYRRSLLIAASNTIHFATASQQGVGLSSMYISASGDIALCPSGGGVAIGTTTPSLSKLGIVGLPTSPAGLNPGDIWVDTAAANVLKIV